MLCCMLLYLTGGDCVVAGPMVFIYNSIQWSQIKLVHSNILLTLLVHYTC